MSLVAEQLLGNEEIVGWKLALKEIHAALNKQVMKNITEENIASGKCNH